MFTSESTVVMLACVIPLLILYLPQHVVAQPDYVRQHPWLMDEDVGYVPFGLSPADNAWWWNKRYRRDGDEPIADLVMQSSDESDLAEPEITGDIQKRDFTAGQLLGMLRQLAKSRRNRQIRIAGKSVRFGISRK